MSSDYIRNLKIDKDKNRMTADIADMRSFPITFRNVELYKNHRTFEEKYSELIFDIISGLLHFKNKSNKLAQLGYGEKTAVELKNYYDDYKVLGSTGVYKKYEEKIKQILKEGTENRKLEIIPSEMELHYKFETTPSKSFEELKTLFCTLEDVLENENISIGEKKKLYKEKINQNLNDVEKNSPILVQYNKEKPYVIVSVYPILKKYSHKDDIYLGYSIAIKNINTNFEKVYHNSMRISYIFEDKSMTQMLMYEMEEKFTKDEENSVLEEENNIEPE